MANFCRQNYSIFLFVLLSFAQRAAGSMVHVSNRIAYEISLLEIWLVHLNIVLDAMKITMI